RCSDRCHHCLSAYLGSRDAADEVLQETFVRLVGGRARLATVDNLVAYVFTVARNEAARHAGRRARHRQRHTSLTAADLFQVAEDALRRETAEAVVAALRQTGDERREGGE